MDTLTQYPALAGFIVGFVATMPALSVALLFRYVLRSVNQWIQS